MNLARTPSSNATALNSFVTRRKWSVMAGLILSLVTLAPSQALAWDGFTAVFAFSETTGQHGWAFNLNPKAAQQTALANCGAGAQIVAYQRDGYLGLVWDESKYAWGCSPDSGQEAYDSAVANFRKIHGSNPSGKKVVSSQGKVLGFD